MTDLRSCNWEKSGEKGQETALTPALPSWITTLFKKKNSPHGSSTRDEILWRNSRAADQGRRKRLKLSTKENFPGYQSLPYRIFRKHHVGGTRRSVCTLVTGYRTRVGAKTQSSRSVWESGNPNFGLTRRSDGNPAWKKSRIGLDSGTSVSLGIGEGKGKEERRWEGGKNREDLREPDNFNLVDPHLNNSPQASSGAAPPARKTLGGRGRVFARQSALINAN